MGYSAPPTFITGAVLTAPQLQVISDDIADLDRRTSPVGSVVVANETCTNASFVDMATVGPAVTVIIGSTLKCEIFLYAAIQGSVAGNECFMGFVASGANTLAATQGRAISFTPGTAGGASHVGAPFLLTSTELSAAGSTTFKAVYARNTSGTANFSDRRIAVTPLGA